jgi:hypothetical protein
LLTTYHSKKYRAILLVMILFNMSYNCDVRAESCISRGIHTFLKRGFNHPIVQRIATRLRSSKAKETDTSISMSMKGRAVAAIPKPVTYPSIPALAERQGLVLVTGPARLSREKRMGQVWRISRSDYA